jgi:hypothetical protein
LLTLFAEKIRGDNPYNKLYKESLSVSPTPRARETTLQRKQGKPLDRELGRQPCRENKESLSVSSTPRARKNREYPGID